MSCEDGNWGVDSAEKLIDVMEMLEARGDFDGVLPEASRTCQSGAGTYRRASGWEGGPPHIRNADQYATAGGGCWWKHPDSPSTCSNSWNKGHMLCKCLP